jgi:inhibitor of cysteine peptidase
LSLDPRLIVDARLEAREMARNPLMTTVTFLLLAMGLVVSPVAASSHAEEAGKPGEAIVRFECEAFAASPAAVESVDVAAGSSVVLSLCSNPSTGYRWSEPASSDPSVASVGGWIYAAPESDLLGASGNEHVTIVADAPGRAVITASYDQPWEGGAKGDWTVALTVNVHDASTLLIGCEEFEAEPAAVRSVNLTTGTSLVLGLCSNPTTGFRWSEPASSDPAVASVSGWVFEAPVVEGGMTGVAGMEYVTIAADAAGVAVITASYDQPWEDGQKGAWSLELTVNVR